MGQSDSKGTSIQRRQSIGSKADSTSQRASKHQLTDKEKKKLEQLQQKIESKKKEKQEKHDKKEKEKENKDKEKENGSLRGTIGRERAATKIQAAVRGTMGRKKFMKFSMYLPLHH